MARRSSSARARPYGRIPARACVTATPARRRASIWPCVFPHPRRSGPGAKNRDDPAQADRLTLRARERCLSSRRMKSKVPDFVLRVLARTPARFAWAAIMAFVALFALGGCGRYDELVEKDQI